jgi:5-methylcytosine-specific restriction endonuclease McrA
MNNPRMTAKERNLLKGAIRRVFSRSDLRRKVVEATRIDYHDPNRPRVKKWSACQCCGFYTPTYQIEVDHKDPLVPINKTLEQMSWDTVVDRTWCEENNLWGICELCHTNKTKLERKARKEANNGPRSKTKRAKKAN